MNRVFRRSPVCAGAAILVLVGLSAARCLAQDGPAPSVQAPPPAQEPPVHDHSQMMDMDMGGGGWSFMQDWVAVGLFNHQGGLRGSDEARAPNWWMGMWNRAIGRQHLTMTTMLSLDPATVGRSGYAEIFQAGETLDGRPIVDRQHPHDLLMQIAGSWRLPVGEAGSFTISGGPSGEPALGPIAFMHRASSNGNPIAPLGHHTFDSTHISFGVMTAAFDRPRWTAEGSVFNGREPDENRWDLDLAPLDSYSGRLWFRPRPGWDLQVSSGKLHNPEALAPGDVVRTTISASWLRTHGAGMAALTTGFGVNHEDPETHASFFTEGSWSRDRNTLYGRFEAHEADATLLNDTNGPNAAHDEADPVFSTVLALTFGGVRRLFKAGGLDVGLGGDVTFYRVPDTLSESYGRPVSAHAFLRLQPSSSARMWNMRMGQPMASSEH